MANENHSDNTHPVLAEIQAYGYACEQLGIAKANLSAARRTAESTSSFVAGQVLIDNAESSKAGWEKIVAEQKAIVRHHVQVLCDYKRETYASESA